MSGSEEGGGVWEDKGGSAERREKERRRERGRQKGRGGCKVTQRYGVQRGGGGTGNKRVWVSRSGRERDGKDQEGG